MPFSKMPKILVIIFAFLFVLMVYAFVTQALVVKEGLNKGDKCTSKTGKYCPKRCIAGVCQ